MPVQLNTITLVPGSTNGSVSLANMQVSALPRSNTGPFAHLELINESGFGLSFSFPSTGGTWAVPANRHRLIPIPPGESVVNWAVLNSYPQGYTQQCFVFYFEFNETIYDLGQNGGSQIGNQARNVELPIAPQISSSRNVTINSGDDQVFGSGGFGASGPPASPFHIHVNGYLYSLLIRANGVGAGVTVAADYTIWLDAMNVASIVASVVMFNGSVVSAQSSTGPNIYNFVDYFCPATPVTNQISLALGTTLTGYQFRIHVNSTVGSPIITWNIGAGVDIANAFGPGTHGNFSVNQGAF